MTRLVTRPGWAFLIPRAVGWVSPEQARPDEMRSVLSNRTGSALCDGWQIDEERKRAADEEEQ
ncbi:hypothetical protein BDBG_08673 [Blastomyces gilchristii SLH14081]|uniref:Uncharacterized protein n=1 Tax=Blastomyces gilchristii (strain SLH14081) TaxID=559298 RepID=A0A179V065_BLAGS|nr:uncharacterized protein BDBG_08673 [Blastomyces gilchristii SLH14081]OAT13480.1 hypothetical protein BDBG_08673 [Blastomyces gilchristii SLH14081]